MSKGRFYILSNQSNAYFAGILRHSTHMPLPAPMVARFVEDKSMALSYSSFEAAMGVIVINQLPAVVEGADHAA